MKLEVARGRKQDPVTKILLTVTGYVILALVEAGMGQAAQQDDA